MDSRSHIVVGVLIMDCYRRRLLSAQFHPLVNEPCRRERT